MKKIEEKEVEEAYKLWKNKSLEEIEANLPLMFPSTLKAIRRILNERKYPYLKAMEKALKQAGR